MRTAFLLACWALLLLTGDEVLGQEIDVLKELKKLPSFSEFSRTQYRIKPLHTVHTVREEKYAHLKPLLEQFARITGSYTVSADFSTKAHVEYAVELCKKYNAKLTIHSAPYGGEPWKRLAIKGIIAQNAEGKKNITRQLTTLKQWIGGRVPVECVIYDFEETFPHQRWRTEGSKAKWRDELTSNIEGATWNRELFLVADHCYRTVKELFGDKVPVVWYGRGWVTTKMHDWFGGKADSSNVPLFCPGDGFSIPLGNPLKWDSYGQRLRESMEYCRIQGVNTGSVWVQLGWAARVQNYETKYSWHIGYQINHPWSQSAGVNGKYPDYSRVHRVILWPPACYSKSPQAPEHLLAYLQGAMDIRPGIAGIP